MRKFSIALAAAGTLIAGPAFAQTADGPFTGPRVGAVLGYDGLRPGSTAGEEISAKVEQDYIFARQMTVDPR